MPLRCRVRPGASYTQRTPQTIDTLQNKKPNANHAEPSDCKTRVKGWMGRWRLLLYLMGKHSIGLSSFWSCGVTETEPTLETHSRRWLDALSMPCCEARRVSRGRRQQAHDSSVPRVSDAKEARQWSTVTNSHVCLTIYANESQTWEL